MNRDEKLLHEIINRRGYLVIESLTALQPGQRMNDVLYNNLSPWEQRPFDTDAKWYCLGTTDLADILEQLRLVRELWPWIMPLQPTEGSNFYRVLSD